MKTHNAKIIFLSVLIAACCTGCLDVRKKYVERRQFLLEADHPQNIQHKRTDITLEVRTPVAADKFDTSQLVYKVGQASYETDFYNEFFISTGPMLGDEIHTWLDESGIFKAVVGASSKIIPDKHLETKIIRLYGDFSGDEPAAEMKIQFLVIDSTGEKEIIEFNKTYSCRQPLESNEVERLILAYNMCLEKILAELEGSLAARYN